MKAQDPIKLRDLAAIVGGTLKGDPGAEVSGVAGFDHAGPSDVAFVVGAKNIRAASSSGAGCLLVAEFADELPQPQIKVSDPQLVWVGLLDRMRPRMRPNPGVSPLASVAPTALIGEGVSIGPFAVIAEGARIGRDSIVYPGVYVGIGVEVGEDCMLYPNVALMDGVRLGNRVTVHASSVIGSDGFGYIQREGRHVKVPQAGGVIVADDVEIGACTTIDRATAGDTVIGPGTKIDNLVQVAHNARLGSHVIMVSQSGIAGSSTLGDYVVVGGQSAISDHVSIAPGTMLSGRAGVTGDIEKKGIYSGTPPIPHREWLKAAIVYTKLPELQRRVQELEAIVARLKPADDKGEGQR